LNEFSINMSLDEVKKLVRSVTGGKLEMNFY
jgi:hypothetical protein